MSIPYIIEKSAKGDERVYDLFSRLMKDRIVFVRDEFNQDMADVVVGQLLFLESADPEADIYMYINSPGGHLTAAFAIYDVMHYIKPDIVTVGFGQCCSAGSFILAGGTKGKRFALPNTQIMIHEMATGTTGKYTEIKNYMKHADELYNKMAKYYHDITGQPLSKIKKDMEKDYFMTPDEAKAYGLIDGIHVKRG